MIANDRNSGRLNVGGIAGGAPGSSLTLGAGNGSIGNLPASGATSGIGVLSDIGNATQLKIELTAMEQQGLSKVISNPKIFTLDNEEAIIFQGNEVPYETVSQEGTNIEFKEAGLRLAVTPTIVGDGNLLLTLQVNKDTVDLTQDNPPITKSEIQTNLVTKDGEIVVMGGIYSESETKDNERVPGLGELLGVGKLFSRDSRLDDRNELIIFIAPKVI